MVVEYEVVSQRPSTALIIRANQLFDRLETFYFEIRMVWGILVSLEALAIKPIHI